MELVQILGIVCVVLIGVIAYHLFTVRRTNQFEKALQLKSEVAVRESELKFREKNSALELDYKNKKDELERASELRNEELNSREKKLLQSQREFKEQLEKLNQKEAELQRAQNKLEASKDEIEKIRESYHQKIHQLAQMDLEEARKVVLEETQRQCEKEVQKLRRDILESSNAKIVEKSRKILLAAMQRISSEPMNDATATLVALPGEEMKGRIIGREGRNIRAFEHTTGTTLMIDETPDSVLISCFDPVRREVARAALMELVKDGHINPRSIEEEVEKAESAMSAHIVELGENALQQLNLSDINDEIVVLLGKLNFHLSNNQNTLAHSVEVAQLSALIAVEIGLDPIIAKRAGLFHDLGKAVNENHDISHALVGAKVVERHGEDPLVVNAVAAHHKEVPAKSAYSVLVMIADSLSAVRPGARTSSFDGFIERIRSIETIAKKQRGVIDVYAIQAGRELRVIVEPSKVSEDEAYNIALRIRDQIEAELNYPGKIEVTVIREQRFCETAV